MDIDPHTADLVLLSNERAKRERDEQLQLISNIKEQLAMAESGQIRAICYAALDQTGNGYTIGASRGESTSHFELIGLSLALNELCWKSCEIEASVAFQRAET